MNVRDKVEQLLITIPQTRENDGMLIAHAIRELYGYTNTFDIALYVKGNVYESIRRARQKIQETNPALRPSKEVYEARLKKEADVREAMRGV